MNVRHVHDLKKNLVSLGTLDSLGCKFSTEGGVLRVSKGILVLIKGQLAKGLYFLQGSTIIGDVAVSSSSSDLESDLTRLWHMCLGYMSEKGMISLSKRGLLGGQKIRKLEFYEHCIYGKHYRVKFSTAIHRTNVSSAPGVIFP